MPYRLESYNPYRSTTWSACRAYTLRLVTALAAIEALDPAASTERERIAGEFTRRHETEPDDAFAFEDLIESGQDLLISLVPKLPPSGPLPDDGIYHDSVTDELVRIVNGSPHPF